MTKIMPRRYTRPNHVQGKRHQYRIPMDYAGELTQYGENGTYWMAGDLVDRLGELEDMMEIMEKENARSGIR